MRAELVVDDQLAAVIAIRLGGEEGGREIGAQAKVAAWLQPDRIVDMRGEAVAWLIAVEQGREDLERQRRGDEQGRPPQRIENEAAQLPRFRRILGHLAIALGQRRLTAGGDVAVDPRRALEQRAGAGRHAN